MIEATSPGDSSRFVPVLTRPRRHQLSRRRGSELPVDVVVVSRPGRWGNPFRVGAPGIPDAAAAVAAHRAWIVEQPELLAAACVELAGRDVACWCPLSAECHGDTLLAIANAVEVVG